MRNLAKENWLIQVNPCDWRTALRQAPACCSKREAVSALAAETTRPMPAQHFPLLAPALHACLRHLGAHPLPLPQPAAAAAEAAACLPADGAEFERRLRKLGAVQLAGTGQCLALIQVEAAKQPSSRLGP